MSSDSVAIICLDNWHKNSLLEFNVNEQISYRIEDIPYTCIEYFNIRCFTFFVGKLIQQHFYRQIDFPIQWLLTWFISSQGSSSNVLNNKNIVANVSDVGNTLEGCVYFVLDDNDLSDLTCQIDTNLQPPQQLNCLSAAPWTSHAQHFCQHYIRKSNTTPATATESTKYSPVPLSAIIAVLR